MPEPGASGLFFRFVRVVHRVVVGAHLVSMGRRIKAPSCMTSPQSSAGDRRLAFVTGDVALLNVTRLMTVAFCVRRRG